MKFSRATLVTVAMVATSSQFGMALEEETISGIKVVKYPVSEVIQRMPKPLIPEGIPAHLQYIVGLDQDTAVVHGFSGGFPFADPEYAIALSSGTFNGRKQKLNRCHGGAWTFYDVETTELHKTKSWLPPRKLTATGRDFLTKISGTDSDCTLTFGWNEDFSEAKIDGYWDSNIDNSHFRGIANSFDLVIEMEPYWRWKFNGVDMEPGTWNRLNPSKLEKMDAMCCPPKENNQCLGENKLGVEGLCETISTACGEVSEENLSACVMFTRRNLFPGGFLEIPIMSNYPVYPLADRYGNPTPYNKFYGDAVSARGVETIFHGTERAGVDEL
mmetsp:Transcript_28014/g.42936  ORF Transcript_28014/g.42936 Transcript_28014/m.42936 type:complete len:329 (-) Transcript_28014:716-1702(-)